MRIVASDAAPIRLGTGGSSARPAHFQQREMHDKSFLLIAFANAHRPSPFVAADAEILIDRNRRLRRMRAPSPSISSRMNFSKTSILKSVVHRRGMTDWRSVPIYPMPGSRYGPSSNCARRSRRRPVSRACAHGWRPLQLLEPFEMLVDGGRHFLGIGEDGNDGLRDHDDVLAHEQIDCGALDAGARRRMWCSVIYAALCFCHRRPLAIFVIKVRSTRNIRAIVFFGTSAFRASSISVTLPRSSRRQWSGMPCRFGLSRY